jgi:hypothetical protein
MLEVVGHIRQRDRRGMDVGFGEVGTHHHARDAAHDSGEIEARIVRVRLRHDGARTRRHAR